MLRCLPLLILAIPILAAPVRKDTKALGILVLDDCDDQFKDKKEYKDNLTLIGNDGTQAFRISGFNNCQSIGSSHMVASDVARKSIWVVENVAHRIRRFDLDGKETLVISNVEGSAIAIDPETGNVWAAIQPPVGGNGNSSKIIVYDTAGKEVKTINTSAWDIVYDRKSKAFWVAEKHIAKINAAKGNVEFSVNITSYMASSIDVDPTSGDAWVAVRKHRQDPNSINQVMKFSSTGKELASIDLGEKSPFRISIDPTDGTIWVANIVTQCLEHYSAAGKPLAEHKINAYAVQVDPAGSDVWVVTPEETLKMKANGEVIKRHQHAGKTSQAWIAVLE